MQNTNSKKSQVQRTLQEQKEYRNVIRCHVTETAKNYIQNRLLTVSKEKRSNPVQVLYDQPAKQLLKTQLRNMTKQKKEVVIDDKITNVTKEHIAKREKLRKIKNPATLQKKKKGRKKIL